MNNYLFHVINQWAGHWSWMDSLMIFMAQVIVWMMLVGLAILWLSNRAQNQRIVFFACFTAAAALLLASQFISPLVQHARPFVNETVHQLIPHANDPSFPSDHATIAFSIAWIVWFTSKRWGSFLLVLATLTGLARVYVGVHYPADIVGAAMLAWFCSIVVVKYRLKLDPIPNFIIKLYRRWTTRIPFIPHSQDK